MSLTGILLAGGQSSRMGRDKAFLEFNGRPLWRHQLDTLGELNPSQLIISANEEQDFGADPGADVVPDEFFGTGPLGGLVTALKYTRGTHVVVLAVDLPYMTSRFLRHGLLTRAYFGSGVIYWNNGYLEPLAALYPKTLLVRGQDCLRRGQFSLHAFAQDAIDQGIVDCLVLPDSHRALFTNVNTPDDLDKVQANRGGQLDLPL